MLFADAVLGRAVFYERDIHSYWVPSIEAFVRSVAEGAWPLWDPLTNFGRPILADPSMQVAYPPTWLNLVLAPGPYYTLFVAAHCAWAGVGAFRLGRAWGLSVAAAGWAGAAWMLSGPFLSMASLYHHFASASWMAWVLLALEGVLRRPGPRSSAWLAAAAAGLALAGSADICFMTGAACVARTAFAAASGGSGPDLRRALAALAGSCVLAALLAAVQWWPTLAHLAVGSRGATGPAANMYWSAHPATLVDAVVPGVVAAMPLAEEWRAAVFEGRGPLLRSLYVGLPVLVLAAGALAAGRWRLRWLVAALAAAFLVAALGRFTPVYPAMVGLPLVRLLRFPVKYLVPASFFLALLSGAGVDAVRGDWDARIRRRMRLLGVVTAAAALAAIAGAVGSERLAAAVRPSLEARAGADVPERIRDGLARLAVLAAASAGGLFVRASRGPAAALLAAPLILAGADLFAAGREAVRLGPPELLRHRPPILDAFPRPSEHRVYAFQYGIERLNREFTRPPAGWDPEWAWVLGHGERLVPPIATRYRISGSFDGDFTGLTPVALSRLTADVHASRDRAEGFRLLRMASVTDVVSFEGSFAGSPPRLERLSVYETPVRVFAVPDPLPRAYVVSGVRLDAPAGEASVVADPRFDPFAEVAVDATAGLSPAAPAGGSAGRAWIVGRRSDRLAVDVSARVPAVLVVTEGFDPGWRAWLDGAPVPVWRANAVFRGVAVPAGDHRVEMRYRPPSAAWGAAASALGAAVAAALLGRRSG